MTDTAGWIQAGCAVLALVGLAIYCFETIQIRLATVEQARFAYRPYLMVNRASAKERDKVVDGLYPFILWNLGNGPARRVFWASGESMPLEETQWCSLGSLAAKDWSALSDNTGCIDLDDIPVAGAWILYSDLSDHWYGLRLEVTKGVFLQNEHQFGAQCPVACLGVEPYARWR